MSAKKILVVDDDTDLVRLLNRKLALAGYEVLAAFDASQAVALAQKEKPALILLDIMLPGGGGRGTLKYLRLSGRTSVIPIIVMTAHDAPEILKDLENNEIDGFMKKPLDLEALLDKIKELTGGSCDEA